MISSHPEWSSYKEARVEGNSIQKWWKSLFRYVDYPFVMAYHGFGNADTFILQGHVFEGIALNNPDLHGSVWRNIVSLLKMFLVKTVENTQVQLDFNGQSFKSSTNQDGFYEFEIPNHELPEGWHQVSVTLLETLVEGQEKVSVNSEVFIDTTKKVSYISDVDDTFLVSHVTQKPLKLYTLLTNNARTRKPVEGVVDFYKALWQGENPFFYVSSSEWNLYEFLNQFIGIHDLPKGILQLKDLKTSFLDFFKSGYGSHSHKRDKIEKILSVYPSKQFVLLGDSGQHDPDIYLDLVKAYPDRIKAVFIRVVKGKSENKTQNIIAQMSAEGISALQFKKSSEALEYAESVGLINP